MRERGASRSSPPATPCQIRARYSGDPRGATGSHGDTDRHAPTTPPDLSSQARSHSCWCGGSRIRTLEGISRRIYSSSVRHRSERAAGSAGKVARLQLGNHSLRRWPNYQLSELLNNWLLGDILDDVNAEQCFKISIALYDIFLKECRTCHKSSSCGGAVTIATCDNKNFPLVIEGIRCANNETEISC
jgi:hypothetical protein